MKTRLRQGVNNSMRVKLSSEYIAEMKWNRIEREVEKFANDNVNSYQKFGMTIGEHVGKIIDLGVSTEDYFKDLIQDHNDVVGNNFKELLESHNISYSIGVIHHEDYLNRVQIACEITRENLIKL